MKAFILLIAVTLVLTVQGQGQNTTLLSWDFRDGTNYEWYPFIANYTVASLIPNGFNSTFGRLPTLLVGSDPNVTIVPSTFNTGYNLRFNSSVGGYSMGLLKRLSGLLPNTTYSLNFTLLYATNVGSNCSTSNSTFGLPGEDVIVKAGALSEEPILGLDNDTWRFRNFLAGDFNVAGRDAMIVGILGTNLSTNCAPDNTTTFFLERRMVSSVSSGGNNTGNTTGSTFNFATNAFGEMWLVVETQSIFRSLTSIWWVGIDVGLEVISQGTGGNGTCPPCTECPTCPITCANCPNVPVVNIFFNGTNFTSATPS